MKNSDTLLEFPCEFPIKVFGESSPDFRELVMELVSEKIDAEAFSVRENFSRNGRYISVTVTLTATSKSQLDEIYRSLSGHSQIMMVL